MTDIENESKVELPHEEDHDEVEEVPSVKEEVEELIEIPIEKQEEEEEEEYLSLNDLPPITRLHTVANLGDVRKFTSLLEDPIYSQDENVKRIYDAVSSSLSTQGEDIINIWNTYNINSLGKKNERLLVLTNVSYIRVVYNYVDNVVERFNRTLLSDILYINYGNFKYVGSKWAPSYWVLKDVIEAESGILIVHKDAINEDAAEDDRQRIFVPILSDGMNCSMYQVVQEIALAFKCAKVMLFKTHHPNEKYEDDVIQTDIERLNRGGLITATFNTFDLGKRKRPSE
ncbi:hypothetical protein PCE1_004419 [Barthelona sp. PCE]